MTHPRIHAVANPCKVAVTMSDGSATITYGELEALANRGAHFLRSLGLKRGDTMAYWLPNRIDVFGIYWAAQRSGLYITPISAKLGREEAEYIFANSSAKLMVIDPEAAGLERLEGAGTGRQMTLDQWSAAVASMPSTPIADESAGFHMVYSSGTTGRPKGVRLPLPEGAVTQLHMLAEMSARNYGTGPDTVYLSPAPLYHTAPLVATTSTLRLGGTVVIMPKFEPEAMLRAIEQYRITQVQVVPTMFIRLLRLPEDVRAKYDLSSLKTVVHAAAPCPVPVKHRMIEWLGPIIHEYYGGSEGNGSTRINSEEWLKKPGSVGKASWGTIHICDDAGNELPVGEDGVVYFEDGWDFAYLGDDQKTRDARNPRHPTWSALGDIGHLDEDGYLFLTDRKNFMIISGGVNIYPQEVENLLVTHPKVADAAVIGVPNPDFGEEVKAVIQPLDPADATPAFAAELMEFCRAHLSHVKCPRSIDFDPALPREDNGKLYKRVIRDRYRAAAEAAAQATVS